MYHITKKRNIKSIFKKGLVPYTPADSWRDLTTELAYVCRVCLFCDLKHSFWNVVRILACKEVSVRREETHEDWTEHDWNKFFNSLVVLKIKTKGLKLHNGSEEAGIDERYVTNTISADRISIVQLDIEKKWDELVEQCA